MKNIELTKNHKSKLLEMCQKLFPEYKSIVLNVPENLNENHLFIMGFLEGNDYIPNCDLYIHWFEFCMIHLADKIYYPNNQSKRDTRSKLEYFFFQSFVDIIEGSKAGYDHPIDYLYTEFKKLKIC